MNEMSDIRAIETFDPSEIRPSKLAHLVIRTNQYRAMVDWYVEVLNGRVALEGPSATFLTYDDEHHRLAICDVPRLNPRDANGCGVDHVAFTFSSLGELLANYLRLTKAGVRPRWCINHGITISFYYEDPDGNRVELQVESLEDPEDARRLFEEDENYAKNPFGAPFDPQRMIDDYRSGVGLNELKKVPEYPAGVEPIDIINEMGLGWKSV